MSDKDDDRDRAEGPIRRRHTRILGGLRASFLTGLVVIAPIGLTVWLVWTVIGWVDGFVLPFVPSQYHPQNFIGIDIQGVGVIFFFLFTLIVGWIAKGLIGRSLLAWAEGLVDRMPVVRSVYNGLKQLAETVLAQSDSSFERACLVEYPREGMWAVAFVSTTTKGEVDRRIPRDEALISVFVPTTPNPTSGFLLFVPSKNVIMLDMSVEDAAKLVISAGLVYPTEKTPAAAAKTAQRPELVKS
ncbi:MULTISPECIES: DUF502 domain-containing protein [Actibacterium]|uniref:Putative membrane protein n=1 Tax=Actibacterium naphthalenivorans TaxID=1614693 RepID=A0A840C8A9_9RHOB|nr:MULTISPECIES: DUF502 domain-containing protein [Actibacterium]ALG90271.1 membrane protein [Actibacterium sp. EMB200-NS6]MBB4022181.1 putative membrane protein [Actibacterium naphthalenivorans]